MNDAKQFFVFRLEERNRIFAQQQADYYAISLVANNIPGAGAMLYFHNPHAPQAAGPCPPKPTGFSCLFNAAFLSVKMQTALQGLPMFRKEVNPVYFLNSRQDNNIRELFEKMLVEVNNNYTFKYELLGNYLAEIIHQAMKIHAE